jgi:hypothetical protein
MNWHNSRTPVAENVKSKIIDYYLSNKDNTMTKMALMFELSPYRISNIVDEYLKKIRN